MKLVIDIPEKYYKKAKEWIDADTELGTVFTAIANGTPLPKHGRLIDADTLEDTIYRLNVKENAQITRHEYKIIDNVIFEMPTIIEADKESD